MATPDLPSDSSDGVPTDPHVISDGNIQENVLPSSVPKLHLRRPHPLVDRMLHKTPVEKDRWGYAIRPEPKQIAVHVSKPQQRVALIVMDRLFKHLEAQGLEVKIVESYNHNGTYAIRGRDMVALSLAESYKNVAHEPTTKELKEKERNSYFKIPKWDSVPTGVLTLSPGGVVDASSEEAIGQLVVKAAADIVAQLDQEQQNREEREARQREEAKRQHDAEAEKSRVTALHKAADDLHRYRLLMDYIAEVRRFGQVPANQRKEGQTLEQWLQWAEWQARILHPLG
jgi:hypothetical protein